MMIHRAAKLVYLAHPHTASRATARALATLGFEAVTATNPHIQLRGVPMVTQRRAQWRVVTTVRNHWDAFASLAAQQHSARTFTLDQLRAVESPYVLSDRLWGWHPDVDERWRYETLDADLARTLTAAGLPVPVLERFGDSGSVRKQLGDVPYQACYTDEGRQYVAERFAQEIADLGYEWENNDA